MMLRQSKPLRLLSNRFALLQHQSRHHKHIARRTSSEDDSDWRTKKKQIMEDRDPGYVQLNKTRGQHLLVNQRVLDAIVRNSNIKPSDTVLEIGPGTGNLTMKLLEASNKVVAVEVDRRMVEAVSSRAAENGLGNKLTVVCGDALKTQLPKSDLVVANIPYSISSPLVKKIVFGGNPYRSATLLLQKEYARRLSANPGDSDYNRLAADVKLVAEMEYVMDVSKRDFVPCPKVDSSVLIIRPKVDIPDVDLAEWLAFTRTCFNKKNKTLGATLKGKRKVMELLQISNGINPGEVHLASESLFGIIRLDDDDDEEVTSDSQKCCSTSELETEATSFKEKILSVLSTAGYEDKRPCKVSSDELLHLLKLLNQAGIYFHGGGEPPDTQHSTS